jgi:hypothetical protein
MKIRFLYDLLLWPANREKFPRGSEAEKKKFAAGLKVT